MESTLRSPRITLLTILFLLPTLAFAVTNVPSTAEPSRIEKQLAPKPTIPSAIPEIIVPKKKKLPTPAATDTKFRLTQINIVGATVYLPQTLLPLYRKYLNKKITISELNGIVEAITKMYRDDGYVLSKAILPEQEVKHGIITIRIIEGYIDRLKIEGSVVNAASLLKAYARPVSSKKPLNIKTLERALLLSNDLPGITLKSVLHPSKTAQGAADLSLVVTQKQVGGSISFDNHGTRYVGPQRATGSLHFNSLFGTADQLSFSTTLTPSNSELKYFNLSYQRPLGTNGLRLFLSTDKTRTRPGFLLASSNIEGRTTSYTARLDYPVIRSRRKNLYLFSYFKYTNSSNDETTGSLFNDRIRALHFGTIWNFVDSFQGSNQVMFTYSQGLPIFGNSPRFATSLSRSNGRSVFSKINLVLSHAHPIGNRFSLLLATRGQYAFSPLLSSEQFGYGGNPFGRAYDYSEITGDRGFSARAELRYPTRPFPKYVKTIRYFIFYDAGVIWNIDGETQAPRASGTSAGVGLTVAMNRYLSGYFEMAKPLTRHVNTETLVGNYHRSFRRFFGLTLSF